MKFTKRKTIILMAAVLLLLGNNGVAAVAKTPTATKTLTMAEGQKKTVVVKGTNIKSKTFKSSNTKVATVNKKGIVTAQQEGNCRITVTIKYLKNKKVKKTLKKVLTTEVTVWKAAKKAKEDLEALKKIVKEQNAAGACIPTDYDNQIYYKWSGDGRLRMIYWRDVGLTGKISFSAFTGLEGLRCSVNKLTGIDVTGCPMLQELGCCSNQLTDLDVSSCPALFVLDCYKNQLTNLDLSNCPKLWDLICGSNQLTNLDLSNCREITYVDCMGNQLKSLDVSKCSALETLECEDNRLPGLDVNGCPLLESLDCCENPMESLDLGRCRNLRELCCGESMQLTGVPAHCEIEYDNGPFYHVEDGWIDFD